MFMKLHPARAEALTAQGRTLTRWSLHDGSATLLSQVEDGPFPFICSLAIAPHGDYFAVASPKPVTTSTGNAYHAVFASGPGFDHTDTCVPCDIEIRHWHDLSLARTIPLPDSGVSVPAMCFSPDGHWLAAADGWGTLYVIDCQSNQISFMQDTTLDDTYVGSTDISALAFDPTSTYLAAGRSGLGGGYLTLYRLEGGALHQVVEDYGADVDLSNTSFEITFSPDSRILAVSANNNEEYIRLLVYDTESQRLKWSLYENDTLEDGSQIRLVYSWRWEYWCSEICFTPDSKRLIMGSDNGDLLFFAAEDGRLLRRYPTGSQFPIARLGLDAAGDALWTVIHFKTDHPDVPAVASSIDVAAQDADGDGMRLIRVPLDVVDQAIEPPGPSRPQRIRDHPRIP